ncbi:MAG: hypothetical protein EZS28_002321, partial [Streblomastix strix]
MNQIPPDDSKSAIYFSIAAYLSSTAE